MVRGGATGPIVPGPPLKPEPPPGVQTSLESMHGLTLANAGETRHTKRRARGRSRRAMTGLLTGRMRALFADLRCESGEVNAETGVRRRVAAVMQRASTPPSRWQQRTS